MMAAARPKGMAAVGAADAARRTEHDGRAFVMRLVGQNARRGAVGVFLPGPLEFGAVLLRAVAIEEVLILPDAGLDEVFGRLLEDGMALFGIGRKQRLAAPALEHGGKLPAEIDHVVEAVIEAVSAVGGMRMRGIAGDEDVADLILFRH